MTKHTHHKNCSCRTNAFLSALGLGRLGSSRTHSTRSSSAAYFKLPDSGAAKAAEAYLAALSSPVMVDHCKRCFLFAQALAEKANAKPDLEILYVGCLFHDLGLEPIFEGPDDFEIIGAREASRFLRAKGYAKISEQVAATIVNHTSVSTANDPRPEVAFLNMGATVDVLGMRIDQIDTKLIQKIIEEYPRNGTKALLTGLLGHEISTKPNSNFGQLEAQFDVLKRINEAPFDS